MALPATGSAKADRPDHLSARVAEPDLRALAERLQEICLEAGLTVATAESCTGGRIGDALTDVAGASGYLRGGVVAY